MAVSGLQPRCSRSAHALGLAVALHVMPGDRERDRLVVHEVAERQHLWWFHLDVADSHMPMQGDHDKNPGGALRRFKLTQGLRDTEGTLHDEILQGRTRCVLLRCLAATKVDPSVLLEASAGVH